jgi:hypothetical protein
MTERRVFDWAEIVSADCPEKSGLSNYTHLRLFHCCRPVELRTYYERGILAMPLDVLAEQFRMIYRDVCLRHIDAAIASVSWKEEPRADTTIDLRYLKEHAKHYITHGSETLKAFAVHLPKLDGKDATDRLRTIGRPTVFVIEAPLDEIDYATLEELDKSLKVLVEKGPCEACDDGDMIDFTVSFPNGVPREWIVRHEIIVEAT